jgi:fumarylacetoacetase
MIPKFCFKQQKHLNKPKMASWIPVPENSDFSLRNLPYGVFSTSGTASRIGVAIGDYVLDLRVLAQDKVFADLDFNTQTLEATILNGYAALGKNVHSRVRQRLHDLLDINTTLGSVLRDNQDRRNKALVPLDTVTMHLPMLIGDYTDFFVGLHHAENVGVAKFTFMNDRNTANMTFNSVQRLGSPDQVSKTYVLVSTICL